MAGKNGGEHGNLFVHIGIHRKPTPGKETILLESMKKFGETQRKHAGLIAVFALKDKRTGALIGLALWDSEEHWRAALPDMEKALKEYDFNELDSIPPEGFAAEPAILI